MQSILNFCFGWPGGQKKCEMPSKAKIPPAAEDADTKQEGLLIPPPLLRESRSPTTPLLPPKGGGVIPPFTTPLLPPKGGGVIPPCHQSEKESRSPAAGTLHPEDKPSTMTLPHTRNIENIAFSSGGETKLKANNTDMPLENLDSEANLVPSRDSVMKKLLSCRCGNMPQDGLFPNGDISQSVKNIVKTSPGTIRGTCKPEQTRMSSQSKKADDAYRTSHCSHQVIFSTHLSFENVHKHEDARKHFTSTQSYFENGVPAKTMKEELLNKGRKTETDEKTNIRSDMDAATMQQSCVNGLHASTPAEDGEGKQTLPKYSVPHLYCCPSCQPAAKQNFGASGDTYNCFQAKQKVPESYLSLEKGFAIDPCLGSRSQCTCSQAIPLH
ncbi:uncharacterized protein LOC112548554 [Alligator sinensis]|uniref:Uncharacterized protein LOC112548554 n=1 Tax=Alligator sinensis TaxID=38654 RepID=A0A3Q0FT18_ALLSI|nr:uncharacterized protein LOC112548554 [Alligator sinensis]XP_025050427.1 uncharacterized protein LOC112548554 [Alligator sinensis]XP_025050428.1 uncharacterized protein LOC112548554 [Alligator sinensis]XP_025050429.1 uncharacterized protein LOC112548554 [Alligator sinensis]XP_025050430.1 uncharacterized protein LOC112548554 [Alligator sinensis]